MRIRKLLVRVVPSACAIAMLVSFPVFAQSTESPTASSTKAATHAKQLKPQTTCPVLGEPIDKNLYVDYNGKRIYVCCADCIEKVKKNPEKYIIHSVISNCRYKY